MSTPLNTLAQRVRHPSLGAPLITTLLFIVQTIGFLFALQGNILRTVFAIVTFFLLILHLIKSRSGFWEYAGFGVSFLIGLIAVAITGSGWLMLIVWHLGVFGMYLMLHWYREISHHTSAFALTHRPYHRMLLIFAGMVTSYVLLHYSLEQVDCDDLDSIVEEYSSEISNWTSSTDSDSTDIVISTDTNSWLYSIQNYWNQLLETREQKKSLDDEVCEIFIEQIHELSERSDFQIGLYVFMYLLAYTLAYIPMYILSYLFTLCVFILTRSGYLNEYHVLEKRRRLQ